MIACLPCRGWESSSGWWLIFSSPLSNLIDVISMAALIFLQLKQKHGRSLWGWPRSLLAKRPNLHAAHSPSLLNIINSLPCDCALIAKAFLLILADSAERCRNTWFAGIIIQNTEPWIFILLLLLLLRLLWLLSPVRLSVDPVWEGQQTALASAFETFQETFQVKL